MMRADEERIQVIDYYAQMHTVIHVDLQMWRLSSMKVAPTLPYSVLAKFLCRHSFLLFRGRQLCFVGWSIGCRGATYFCGGVSGQVALMAVAIASAASLLLCLHCSLFPQSICLIVYNCFLRHEKSRICHDVEQFKSYTRQVKSVIWLYIA